MLLWQSTNKLYFVLDYCAGGELFFHLGRDGKFSEERSRFYAAQVGGRLLCVAPPAPCAPPALLCWLSAAAPCARCAMPCR